MVERNLGGRSRLPPLPLACFLAPIPLTALAERSSRREGGDYKFFCRGLRPPRPGIRPFTVLKASAAVVPRRGGLALFVTYRPCL